jgi:hypothetical protein
MQYFNERSTSQAQWQTYSQLELLPHYSQSRVQAGSLSLLGLGWIWRHFIRLLIAELVEEQRQEYLDRCFSQDLAREELQSPTQSLKRLLWLMS